MKTISSKKEWLEHLNKKQTKPTGTFITGEAGRECHRWLAEEAKRELSDALWRRHQARKTRRAKRNDEWMTFATRLYEGLK